jgi:tripartite-type tricarboxylate transporter receptor subunit TctC
MRFVTRRVAALSLLAAAIVTPAVQAADYPVRPIRFVVNSAAGALLDVTVRAFAQAMGETLGQPIIVDNRTGADGLIGIRYVKSQPADGYTVLLSANTVAQAPAFKVDAGYDLDKDFAPVGMLIRAPFLMVGPPNQPSRTLAEFVTQAKANPEKMSMASAGVGTSTHMAAALFMHQAGIKMLHVPYKGNAAAMPDVIGGRINAIFDGGNSSGPAVRDGRLRAYGITSAQRSPAFPDIPTLAEQGYPNYSFHVYFTMLAPAGTPRDVVAKLNQALRQATTSEVVRSRLRQDGADAWQLTPEQTGDYLRRDLQQTVRVVNDLGLPREN